VRILGVDLGDRRVGLAICDAEERIASPLGVARVRSHDEAEAAVLRAVGETGAEAVVLGFPLHLNGRSSPRSREAERFARRLRERGLRVALQDERLTSAEADRSLRSAKMTRRERKGVIDAVAAQRILESHLHRRAAEEAEEEPPS
jgi:putative Holliday junction resolvase